MHLAHVCLRTTDLEQTRRFYCDGIGCRQVFRFLLSGKEVGFYLAINGHSFLEVFRVDAVILNERSPINHLCLQVDDIDTTIARLERHGYAPVSPKQLGADRSYQVWFTDPDGASVEFHEYTAESCQRSGADCHLD